MELRHLKYFIAVAEELSFSKAARRLKISQPPLSKQIRDLEEYLNQSLFLRSNKKVELTEAGHNLVFRAYKILDEFDEVETYFKYFKTEEGNKLSIAFSESALVDLIDIVKDFKKCYPDTKFNFTRMSAPDQIQALESQQLDIGFSVGEFNFSNKIITKTISKHEFYLVLNKEHPLAENKNPISFDSLTEETFIITPRKVNSSYFDIAFSVFNKNNFFPQETINASSSSAIIALIKAGLGISLVPISIKDLFSNEETLRFKKVMSSDYIYSSVSYNSETKNEIVKIFFDFIK